VSQITKAASMLLARPSTPTEIFIVRRAEKLRFMGGFYAFPGGKFSPSDLDIPLVHHEPVDGSAGRPDERCATAARELFEETGVLVARKPDGTFPSSGSVLRYLRRKLMADELSFGQILDRLGLSLWAADFQLIGSITTPPFVPTRFDTAFYLIVQPENQTPEIWPGELDRGEWSSPGDMMDRWTRGECLVSPPTVMILDAIRRCPIGEIPLRMKTMADAQANAPMHSIFFSPGVQTLPLHTMALPPSTHTNAYLVGEESAYLIDPGTSKPEEQEKLFAMLDSRVEKGLRLKAVVLTHHHPDHIGAANATAARYHLPTWAHPLTAEKLQGRIAVNQFIQHGDRLDLGAAPDGTHPWYLEAIHTPGHAPGHLVFYDPHYRVLLAADIVSTLSSIVIGPPDGDLVTYLATLRKLLDLDCRLLLPAHGGASPRYRHVIEESIAHRIKREQQLMAALDGKPRAIKELALTLYKGLPEKMMRFAEMQVRAGLDKLRSEGRVESSKVNDDELFTKVAGKHNRKSYEKDKIREATTQ
jgi:glyoxylase-like metal-dependent hydrolase (beta-lactamase superfamily II)/8-oxo-dGTP pyrophosphatase MutT (NUDIX family)